MYDISGVQVSRRLLLGVVQGFYDGLPGLCKQLSNSKPLASKMFHDEEAGSLRGIPQSRLIGVCAGASGAWESGVFPFWNSASSVSAFERFWNME